MPQSRLFRRTILAFIVAISVVHSRDCSAGFVPGMIGSTNMSLGGNANGLVNWAVFQNTTNDWLTTLGVDTTTPNARAVALAGTIDKTDTYVYLYQIVNLDPASSLVQLKVGFDPISSITSMGYLDHRIFLDGAGNQVGPAGSPSLNNTLLGTGTTSSGPGGPASINAIGANPNSGGNQASFAWNPSVGPKGFSSIVFVTSNSAPSTPPGSLRDNAGNQSVGAIPGVVPEPSSWTLILMGSGVILLAARSSRSKSGQ